MKRFVVAACLWFLVGTVEAACPGCCFSHGGITQICATDGRVVCVDGTISPTCSCSSCDVPESPGSPPGDGVPFPALVGSDSTQYSIDPEDEICIASPDACPDWVRLRGNVMHPDWIPLCALVLANGQYTFSCDGTGYYDMRVPRDENGGIELFVGADGFAPFGEALQPGEYISATLIGATMQAATPDSPTMEVTSYLWPSKIPGWIHINGDVWSQSGESLCALALANAQVMLTCGGNLGYYQLVVPIDENGQVTLFVFADGFQPYSATFDLK